MLIVYALTLAGLLMAQSGPCDPQGLVREVVANELQAAAHPQPRWMYRLAKTNASGTRVTRIVETRQGLVSHLLEMYGAPLDPLTRRNEAHRLQELRASPQQWKSKLARQERDRSRVLKIVRALPDAFLYSYEGTAEGPYGSEMILRFVPNPGYSPDSMETQILKSMAGTLRIAMAQKRLVRLEGSLRADAKVGLGVIAKFDKGANLEIQQAQIAPDSWELTHLKLVARGRTLFRPLDLSVEEFATEFEPVSSNLTVAQAIDLLLAKDRG